MAQMHRKLVQTGRIDNAVTSDEESRAHIVTAMIGCSQRYSIPAGESSLQVLELGAGSGRDMDFLSAHFNASYQGVEVVKAAAAALAGRNVHHMAVEDLPDGWSSCFHFIYSRHVMEHVMVVDTALQAIKKVLAPDGIVGAVTPHFFPDPEPAHVAKLNHVEWIEAYLRNGLHPVYCEVKTFGVTEAHLVAVHSELVAD